MPVRQAVRKAEHFVVHHILHLDDTPHRIALGVALAVWLAWTPTIGLQSVLLVSACALLGANKAVGLPFVWISNPATLVPIFYPNYLAGCWLLRRAADEGGCSGTPRRPAATAGGTG